MSKPHLFESNSSHYRGGDSNDRVVTVVALGDSLLSGDALESIDDVWLHRAAKQLADSVPVDIRVTNLAQTGGRLRDIGRQAIKIDDQNTDIIVIEVGSNDASKPHTYWRLVGYRRRYRRMLRALATTAPQLLATGVGDLSRTPLLSETPELTPIRPLVKLGSWYVNRQITKAVDQHRSNGHQIALIQPRDVEDRLVAGKQWNFAADRYHPSAKGHEIWADLVQSSLSLAVDRVRRVASSQQRLPQPRFIRTRMGWARILTAGRPDSEEVVVVIPDAPNALEHYQEMAQKLLGALESSNLEFTVLGLEMPGLGQSRAESRYGYTLRDGAEWIRAVLDRQGVKEAVIATTCINGLWAAKLAQIDPRVEGLVLGQTPSLEDIQKWGRSTIKRPVRMPIVGDLILRVMAARETQRWYRKVLGDQRRFDHFNRLAANARAAGAEWKLAGMYRAIRREEVDPFDHLRGRDIKITRFWGQMDGSYADLEVPETGVVPLDDVGHFPDLEASALFSDAIVSMVDSVASSRTAVDIEYLA